MNFSEESQCLGSVHLSVWQIRVEGEGREGKSHSCSAGHLLGVITRSGLPLSPSVLRMEAARGDVSRHPARSPEVLRTTGRRWGG